MKHGTNLFWLIILVSLAALRTNLRVLFAQDEGWCRSVPLNARSMFRDREPGVRAFAARRDRKFTEVLTRHIRQKAYYAC